MTSGSTRTVDHAGLTLGAVLGRGGQGTVYPVANRRINEAVDGGWEVVYKEYNPATLALLDAEALRAMVDLLGDLDAADARWLCDKTAWPVAVVERSGQVCGFLMRAVPDRFRFGMRALSGSTPPKTVLATAEFLLNDEKYIADIGLTVSLRDRLDLLKDLAASLDRLHRLGIAVGDLSPKNLLFATGQDAGFFIIDCDAMRVHGVSALPQVETPDWQAPSGEERATSATDVYKFGLLAARMAAGDQTTTDTMPLTTAGAGLGHLARASLDADPAQRPASPAEWISELSAAAEAAPQAAPTPPRTSTSTPTPTPTPSAVPVYPHSKPAGKILARVGGLVTAAVIVLAIALTSGHTAKTATVDSGGGSGSSGGFTTSTSGGSGSGGGDASGGTTSGDSSSGGTSGGTSGDTSGGSSTTGGTSSGGDSSSGGTTSGDSGSGGTTSGDSSSGGTSGGDTTGGYTPQPPPPPPDVVKNLSIGDCVTDSNPSTATNANLSTSACVPGAYKVVGAFDDTTDMNSCNTLGHVSQSVSSSADNRVVCLSYQANGTAYWADPGQCVYGQNTSGSSWDVEDCQTGNFKVVARYPQTSDKGKCPAWPQSDEDYTYSNDDSGLAVVLCLVMNYPDALGLATQNECLVKNGDTFTNVDSCPASNVVVSGRTGTYDDPGFCGQDGASWWRPSEFPELGYTVCWRWKQ